MPDKQRADHEYLIGADWSIADMAAWPWYGGLAMGGQYGAAEFLAINGCLARVRWAEQTILRPSPGGVTQAHGEPRHRRAVESAP